MAAASEKDAGTAAWKAGNFSGAVEHFSNAIKESANDREALKILYSNRSAAYLKMGSGMQALADATRCLEIEPNWPKGLARKGDALMVLRRHEEALTVFETIVRTNPNDNGAREKVSQIRNKMASSGQGSASYRYNTASAASVIPGTALNFSASNRLVMVQSYLRVAIVFCFVGYLIPFRVVSSSCHRYFLFCSILNCVIALYNAHGFPKFSNEYLQRILPETHAQLLFLTIMQLSVHGYMLAMMPIFLLECAHFVPYAMNDLTVRQPAVLDKATMYINQYLPKAVGLSTEDWVGMPASDKWNIFYTLINKLSATAEVMQGLYLVIELVMPTRNFLFIYLWYNYLTMRYMQDRNGCLKEALSALDMQFMNVLSHRLCPAMVRNGYVWLKQTIIKQVPVPGQSMPSRMPNLSGMMSRCTVM